MTNKPTLIIPTHNRQHAFKDLFVFYQKTEFNICLVDSSEKIYLEKIPDNIEYYHFPNYSFCNKILKISQIIGTTYVGLVADDDFFIGNFNKCVSHLKETGCCVYTGTVSWFDDDSKFKNVRYSTLNKQNIYAPGDKRRFLSNYVMILWAVFRREELISIFQHIYDLDIKNDNFIELIIGYLGQEFGGIYVDSDFAIYRHIDLTESSWGARHVPLTEYVDFDSEIDRLSTAVYINKTYSFKNDARSYISKNINKHVFIKKIIKRVAKSFNYKKLMFRLRFRFVRPW